MRYTPIQRGFHSCDLKAESYLMQVGCPWLQACYYPGAWQARTRTPPRFRQNHLPRPAESERWRTDRESSREKAFRNWPERTARASLLSSIVGSTCAARSCGRVQPLSSPPPPLAPPLRHLQPLGRQEVGALCHGGLGGFIAFYSVTRARDQVCSLFHNNSHDKKNEERIKSREVGT